MIPLRPVPDAWRRPLFILDELARGRGQTVWLVGGAVRDLVAGRVPLDGDLAASGDALALGRAWAGALGFHFVLLKEDFATGRVVSPGLSFDLVGLRAPDLAGDLAARDFTANALALDLSAWLAGRVYLRDPLGGLEDLAAGRLRACGPDSLAADPLRVLRAYRFQACLGLVPEPELRAALVREAAGLARVARERIGHEWRLMLAGSGAVTALLAMAEDGALFVLCPELAAGRGVAQNPYHHLDILDHGLACLAALGAIAAAPAAHLGGLASEAAAYLADPRRRALCLTAALLHDVGKPATRQEEQPGWASFHRHDVVGGALAEGICRRLDLGKVDSRWVANLVAGHMRPFHLLGVAQRGGISHRAARRLLESAGEDLMGLLVLSLADTLAGKGPLRPPEAEERLLALFSDLVRLRDESLRAALAAPPLVDGRVLMAALRISPGPLVGRLLGELREAQLDRKIATPAEALALARELLAHAGREAG